MKLNDDIFVVFDDPYAIIFDYQSGEFYSCEGNMAKLLLGIKEGKSEEELCLYYEDIEEYKSDLSSIESLKLIKK